MTHPDPAPLPPVFRAEIQAFLGFFVGGVCWLTLILVDPLGVTTSQIIDGQVVQENRGLIRPIGQVLTFLTPLFVAGLCGMVLHPAPRPSLIVGLSRVLAVALTLLLVGWVGSEVIERTLSNGGSSDVVPGLVALGLVALCLALAAPLSSLAIRLTTRPRSIGDRHSGQTGPSVQSAPVEN